MYTIERLEKIAAKHKEKNRFSKFNMYFHAIHAIQHMKAEGIDSIARIGPFHAGDVEKVYEGQTVILKAGSKVRSFNPSKREYFLKRRQEIVVARIDMGRVDLEDLGFRIRAGKPFNETHVVWAGQGGYWCMTSIENVEKIIDDATDLVA